MHTTSLPCNAAACSVIQQPHRFACVMQEYVNELAQSLVDVDKNSQDVIAAEKIKRLCNEAVRVMYPMPVDAYSCVHTSACACTNPPTCFFAGSKY